jgi:hypothetical protein
VTPVATDEVIHAHVFVLLVLALWRCVRSRLVLGWHAEPRVHSGRVLLEVEQTHPKFDRATELFEFAP